MYEYFWSKEAGTQQNCLEIVFVLYEILKKIIIVFSILYWFTYEHNIKNSISNFHCRKITSAERIIHCCGKYILINNIVKQTVKMCGNNIFKNWILIKLIRKYRYVDQSKRVSFEWLIYFWLATSRENKA